MTDQNVDRTTIAEQPHTPKAPRGAAGPLQSGRPHPGPATPAEHSHPEQSASRRFELHRDVDVTGISGSGVVADGVVFPDGVVALRWRSAWPTSVVFHDRGIESVTAIHGHGGATRIVWLDERSWRS